MLSSSHIITLFSHMLSLWFGKPKVWKTNAIFLLLISSLFDLKVYVSLFKVSLSSLNFFKNRSNCTCPTLRTTIKIFPWIRKKTRKELNVLSLTLSHMRTCHMTLYLVPYRFVPQPLGGEIGHGSSLVGELLLLSQRVNTLLQKML